MYQARFRHRNVLQSNGNNAKYEQYYASSCSVAPSWSAYYTATPGVNYQKIDHMDDVSGDRPTPNQGPSGYKFHPMTRVTGEFVGNGDSAWEIQAIAQSCVGTSNVYNQRFRKAGSQNAARDFSGISSFTMIGDRIDCGNYLPASTIARLSDLTSTAVLAQRGKFGESNLYESLAEIDKTLGMLKDIFERAHRLQNALFFKKGGVAKLRSMSNEVAAQYLATRYGFKPLIQDLKGILAGLDKPLGSRIVRVKSSETWRSVTNTTLPTVNDADSVFYTRNLRTDELLTVRSIALDNVELTMMKVLGLGWKDLLTVPWELKSYSFVVDWFANVGDYLSWFAPDIGLSPVGSCTVVDYSRVDTVSYGITLASGRVGTYTLTSGSPPPTFSRLLHYKDRRSMSLVPHLNWKSDFKFDNLTRVLDAAALFTQQASKIRASGGLTEVEEILRLRRKRFNRAGIRKADDFRNLSD